MSFKAEVMTTNSDCTNGARRIRLASAAYAIETNGRTLNNWFAREQLGSIGERHKSQGLSFNLVEIAALAITRKLVDYGILVEVAHLQAINSILNPILSTLNHEPPFERNEIEAVLVGQIALISKNARCELGLHTEVIRANNIAIPSTAVLIVPIEIVVKSAIHRALMHESASARSSPFPK